MWVARFGDGLGVFLYAQCHLFIKYQAPGVVRWLREDGFRDESSHDESRRGKKEGVQRADCVPPWLCPSCVFVERYGFSHIDWAVLRKLTFSSKYT